MLHTALFQFDVLHLHHSAARRRISCMALKSFSPQLPCPFLLCGHHHLLTQFPALSEVQPGGSFWAAPVASTAHGQAWCWYHRGFPYSGYSHIGDAPAAEGISRNSGLPLQPGRHKRQPPCHTVEPKKSEPLQLASNCFCDPGPVHPSLMHAPAGALQSSTRVACLIKLPRRPPGRRPMA